MTRTRRTALTGGITALVTAAAVLTMTVPASADQPEHERPMNGRGMQQMMDTPAMERMMNAPGMQQMMDTPAMTRMMQQSPEMQQMHDSMMGGARS